MNESNWTEVSVVIPAYNREASIAKAIQSVANGTEDECEIIVVDDGSTDQTLDQARRAMARWSGKRGGRVIAQQNSGPGAARNRGSLYARGSYLAFLDSDDVWLPHTLSSVVRALREARASGASRPALVFLQTADLEEGCHVGPYDKVFSGPRLFEGFLEAADTLSTTRYASCNVIVRRDVFEGLKGFTEAVKCSEDTDLFLRAANSGPCMVLSDRPYVIHKIGGDDQLTSHFDLVVLGFKFLMARDAKGEYFNGLTKQRLKDRFLSQCAAYTVRRSFAVGRAGLAYRLYFEHLPLFWRAQNWHWLTRLPIIPLLSVVRPESYKFARRTERA